MSSKFLFLMLVIFLLISSCASYNRIQQIFSGEVGVTISVSDEPSDDGDDVPLNDDNEISDDMYGPVVMNAVRDDVTGEMVAVDVLSASKVVARFRNVAERGGWVTIGFDVNVPAQMADSRWQLKLFPLLYVRDDTMKLAPVFITGLKYRERQMKGYQRYKDFVASILTDTTDLIRMGQLEIFIERNFPEVYAMKTDSSIVSDDAAASLFGVTQKEAARHYIRSMKVRFNERKKSRLAKVYDRYVPDPIISEGVRLDTVITSLEGDFIYKYVHTFKSLPGLKKVRLTLNGEIYEDGHFIGEIPYYDSLTFYISTLSSIADTMPRYKKEIIERKICEKFRADIAFEKGSDVVDSTLSDNASELHRVLKCIHDVGRREKYVFDSLVIVASCSPEGRFSYNKKLSAARSEAVRKYLGTYLPDDWNAHLKTSHIPEDWGRLGELVSSDIFLAEEVKVAVREILSDLRDPDLTEKRLSRLSEYEIIRKRIYPELRTVTFDVYMHHEEMDRDTVCTSVLDTLYMSGLQALRDMDYKKAATVLGPYQDYNAALAFIAADMNHTALKILDAQDPADALICYLKSMVMSRLEKLDEAVYYFELSISSDPMLEYRANLDPEMSLIVNRRKTLNKN